MSLKARVTRPISSREVTGTTVSSSPLSTALVPASRRRTGRDRPRESPAGDQQAEQAGERGDRDDRPDDVGLMRLRRVGRGGDDPIELRSRLVELRS